MVWERCRAARDRRPGRRDRRQPRQRPGSTRCAPWAAAASRCSARRPGGRRRRRARPPAGERVASSCCCRSCPSGTRSAPRDVRARRRRGVGLYAEHAAAHRGAVDRVPTPTPSTSSPRTDFVRRGTLGGGERDAQTIFDYGIEAASASRRRQLRRAGSPAPHPADGGAGAGLVRGFADPGRLRRGAGRQAVLLVEVAEPARQGASACRSRRRGRCAPCAARSTSSPPPNEVGDAWLRVYVRERPGPGSPTRCGLLPRAGVDVRIERPSPARRRPHVARAAGPREPVRRLPRERRHRRPASVACSDSSTTSAMAEAAGRCARSRCTRGLRRLPRPVDIDFDGVDYFALIGPTGAGKSTVIDAHLLRPVRQRAPLRRRAA